MIDINKKTRSRDGREDRIYATDGGGGCPGQGTKFSKELGWLLATWSMDGCALNDIDHPADLVEVKPRIKRTLWVNVFPKATTTYLHRLDADAYGSFARLACVKVEIDCEEGEGL